MGETKPKPNTYEVVVFQHLFTCELRLPSVSFLQEVLDSSRVQLHQLTPNDILNLTKFYWAYRTFGLEADIDCFCVHYELQNRPKHIQR